MNSSTLRTYLSVAICILITISCKQRPNTNADSTVASVEMTLGEFSRALATGDTVALRRLTGPSFTLLEDGREYDLASTITSIQQALRGGNRISRRLSDFHSELRGNVAWSHYRVAGEFQTNLGSLGLSLLEASVLERVGDQWRIVQMTTIPAAIVR